MINQEPKRALLLAAGRGRRLRPFTDTVPKPLLPINGRPTLDFVLGSLQAAGITDVAFVVHHLAEQIQTFVADGCQWDITPHFFHQSDMKGTGHAIQTAVSFLTTPTIIMATDYILPVEFIPELKQHYLSQQTDLAISLKELTPEQMRSRSSVRLDNKGLITEIVEKPALGQAPSQYGGSLIYIVPPQITEYLSYIEPSPRGEYEMQDAVNLMLQDGYTMCGLLQGEPPEWQKP